MLSETAIFQGVSPQEVEEMLECLGRIQRRFAKGEMICQAGETAEALGLVLSGSVLIENNDFWGNSSVLDRLGPGQIFAETYACIPGERMMVSVVAAEPSEVLLLHMGKVLQTCEHTCPRHVRLIRNLLAISAQKNLSLSRRIFHTSPKSIRGRLISYLSYQAAGNGSRDFTIPFNRQQLADYLNVDRSALSNELSKMQREGLLEVDKNHFYLKSGERIFGD